MMAQEEHAAQISPVRETPTAWFEAGLRLLQAGRLAEAEQCGRNALALDQGHADSLHLMGTLCVAARQYDLAIEWFAMAIRQNPEATEYFSNLGLALQRGNRFDEAIKSYDRALVLKADQADIWFRMGECLQQQKRTAEAILSFGQALKINPAHADAARCSALLYLEERKYEQAIENFDRLLQVRPDLAGAFKLKEFCLLQLSRPEEALASSSKALELAPDDADILNNIALMLHRLGRDEEALSYADNAIALNPLFPAALNNRAQSLLAMRRFEEAMAALDGAIAIDPDFALARWNKALTQLLLGNFEAGWALRECGRTRLGFFVDRKFKQPQWLGAEPIAGKTILLHSDEGLGDTIQYVRYVKLVAELGAQVILQVDEPVRALLSAVEGAALCLPRSGVELPDFDIHCPLSGLPLAFKTRLETVPSDVPYLPPPPEKLRHAWEKRLGSRDKMRVVWFGPAGPRTAMITTARCRLHDV